MPRKSVRLYEDSALALEYLLSDYGPYGHQSQAIQQAIANATDRDLDAYPDGNPVGEMQQRPCIRCFGRAAAALDKLDQPRFFPTESHAIRAALIAEACVVHCGILPTDPEPVMDRIRQRVGTTDEPMEVPA